MKAHCFSLLNAKSLTQSWAHFLFAKHGSNCNNVPTCGNRPITAEEYIDLLEYSTLPISSPSKISNKNHRYSGYLSMLETTAVYLQCSMHPSPNKESLLSKVDIQLLILGARIDD